MPSRFTFRNDGGFLWLIAATVFLSPYLTFAYFAPGETLNPSCSPGDSGCDIETRTLSLASSTAPVDTDEKLYNLDGTLYWNGSEVGGGSGLTSLNGLTGSTQTFANDTNVTIVSSGSTHTLTWSGQLSAARGGTGLSSVSANQLLIGNSAGTGWTQVATSSLGIAISDTTGTLAVARGGTGATTLTGVLIGNGTSAFTATTTLSAAYVEDAYVRNTGDSISGSLTFSGSTANIALGSNYLSGDGDDEGVFVDSSGRLGIGTTTPGAALTIVGGISAPTSTGFATEAYGAGAIITSPGDYNLAIGPGSQILGSHIDVLNNTVIGANAMVTGDNFQGNNTVIGAHSSSSHQGNTIIGAHSFSSAGFSVVIGQRLQSYRQHGILIGSENVLDYGTAGIGSRNNVLHPGAFVTGSGNSSQFTDEFSFGNNGEASSTPSFRLGGSTNQYTSQDLFQLQTSWIDSTNATRKSRTVLNVFDTSAQEFLRADATGSGATVAFLGGNVGIGTTSPESLLNIIGSSTVFTIGDTRDIAWTSGDQLSAINFTSRDSSSVLANASRAKIAVVQEATFGSITGLAFSTRNINDYGERVRITNAGNVGIGTTTPTSGLDIYQKGVAITSQGSTSSPVLLLRNSSNAERMSFTYDNTNIALNLNNRSGISLLNVQESTGRVGIGTTTPAQTLTVVGSARVTGSLFDSAASAGTSGMILSSTGSGTAWIATSTLAGNSFQQGGNSFGTTATLGTNDSNNLAFETGGTTRLAIDSSGRVGIGTSTATSTFNVIGDVRIQGSGSVHDWNEISPGNGVSSALLKIGLDANGNGLVIKQPVGASINTYFGIFDEYGGSRFAVTSNSVDFGSAIFNAFGMKGGSFFNTSGVEDRNAFSAESTTTPALLVIDDRDDITANDRTIPLLRFAYNDTPILINSLGGINPFNRSGYRGLSLMTYNATSSSFVENVTLLDNGNVGVGTAAPVRQFHAYATSTDPVARFQNADGYCEIDPTNTALVCVSDQKLKTNVMTLDDGVLDGVLSLNPVNFDWKTQVGEGTEGTRGNKLGLIAQEVEEVFPMLVATDETGTKNVAYSNFTPLLIKAVQELSGISSSTTPLKDRDGKKTFVGRFFDRLSLWFADSTNGIGDFFAKKVFTDEICVKKDDGTHYCVSGDELEETVEGGSTQFTPPPNGDDNAVDTTDDETSDPAGEPLDVAEDDSVGTEPIGEEGDSVTPTDTEVGSTNDDIEIPVDSEPVEEPAPVEEAVSEEDPPETDGQVGIN